MSLLWLDGEVRPTYFAPFDLRDRGLQLGDGIFETLLVVNRKALWLGLHLDRMDWSAKALGIPFHRGKAEQAVGDLMAKVDAGPQSLRLTLTRGITARGLAGEAAAPSFFASLDVFDAKLIGQDVTLHTTGVRRSTASPAAIHKTLSYVDNIVAAREALAQGFGDALMLNTQDHVACSTIGNIFLKQGGKLVTPALDQGILPGVTRAVILTLAAELDLETEERAVAPVELFAADAVFLCNSLRLVRPVTQIDARKLGEGDVSPVLEALLAAVAAQCGAKVPIS